MYSSVFAVNDEPKKEPLKKTRITWQKVDGALAYHVEIRDINNKRLVFKKSDKNSLDFVLPNGSYKLRIGAYNKFNKIAAWSAWGDIKINHLYAGDLLKKDLDKKKLEEEKRRKLEEEKRRKLEEERKKNKGKNPYKGDGIFAIGLKLSIGWSFNQIIDPWTNAYDSSPLAGQIVLSYGLGNINSIKKIPFVKWFGLDYVYHYVRYTSKASIVGLDSKLQLFSWGLNLSITSDFDFPLNFIIRFGGGLTYSNLNFTTSGLVGYTDGTYIRKSFDFFWNAGVAMEIRFWHVHFEIGADFYNILYTQNPMYGIRYFISAGVRF